MNKNSERLGTEPIGKLLFRFSLPAIIGTSVFASTNIVNTIFIGRGVGSIALTAISLVFPIFAINMAIGMLVGIGGGALISIRLGEGKKEEAERILGGCFFLFIILGLSVTLAGQIFLDPILMLLGASTESLPYAHEYMRVIFFGVVITYIAMGLNNLMRAEGHPKLAMNTMLIGAILNVIFNYLFVIHMKIGVKGAGYATLLSTAASAAWVLYHFFSGGGGLQLKKAFMKFDRRLMQPALLIGLAPFLMQIVASVVGVTANRSLSQYGGDTAVACMGIIYSVMMLLIFPIIGINQGAQPILGFNYGAGKFDRVRRTLLLSVAGATIVATLGTVAAQVFPETIFTAFSKGDHVLIDEGTRGLRIMFAVFFLVGFQAISANYFQAVGKPNKAILLNLLRQAILYIPMLIILPKFFGVDGVWFAAPISDFIAAVITAIFIIKELKHLSDQRI
ncbi:MAG: MATE family efflux transporter [Fibrobacteres bacterium]|nr:MATE family efflux transporter [Fibrobacterota bacterium]